MAFSSGVFPVPGSAGIQIDDAITGPTFVACGSGREVAVAIVGVSLHIFRYSLYSLH